MLQLSEVIASAALDTMTELYTLARAISQARTPGAALAALRSSCALHECQQAAIGLFNRPWEDAAPPECLDVLAEWSAAADQPVLTSPRFAPGIDWLVKACVSASAGVAQDVNHDTSLSEAARAQLQTQCILSYALKGYPRHNRYGRTRVSPSTCSKKRNLIYLIPRLPG